MQPDPLPLPGRETPRLVPDRIGHTEPAEAVHQPTVARQRPIRDVQVETPRRSRAKIGDGPRVSERVRRLEVDEVRDSGERRVRLFMGEGDAQRWLRTD